MKLTCIVAMHNNQAEIGQLIDSICANNPLEGNYELIFCDDSSTDQTLEIARSKAIDYQVQYKFLESEQNLRYPGKLINQAIALADGEFVHIIDGDDIVINQQYEYVLKTNAQIIGFDYMRYDHIAKRIVAYRRQSMKGWSSFYWNRIIKRELITNNQVLMTEDKPLQDCIFMADLFSLNPQIEIIKKPIYIYRTHIKSISTNSNVELIVAGFDYLYNKYKSEKQDERIKSLYTRLLVRYIQVCDGQNTDLLVSKLVEMRNYLISINVSIEFKMHQIEYYINKIIEEENYSDFSILSKIYLKQCSEFGITDIKHFRTFEISNSLGNLVSTTIIVKYLNNINHEVDKQLFAKLPSKQFTIKDSLVNAVDSSYQLFAKYGIEKIDYLIKADGADMEITKVEVLNTFKNIEADKVYTLSDNLCNNINEVKNLMPTINDITIFKNNQYQNGSGLVTNHKYNIVKKRLDSVFLALVPGHVLIDNNIKTFKQLRNHINTTPCEYIPLSFELSKIQQLEFKLESAKIKYFKRKV